eukprot:scaffold22596_cov131-Cylindrotheca_fusiformis.AAC.27
MAQARNFERVTAFSSWSATAGAVYSAGSGESPPVEESYWDIPYWLPIVLSSPEKLVAFDILHTFLILMFQNDEEWKNGSDDVDAQERESLGPYVSMTPSSHISDTNHSEREKWSHLNLDWYHSAYLHPQGYVEGYCVAAGWAMMEDLVSSRLYVDAQERESLGPYVSMTPSSHISDTNHSEREKWSHLDLDWYHSAYLHPQGYVEGYCVAAGWAMMEDLVSSRLYLLVETLICYPSHLFGSFVLLGLREVDILHIL